MIRIRDWLNDQRLTASGVFLAMLATIMAALYFEHFLGYVPCALCLQQRVPYYVAIGVCVPLLVGRLRDQTEWGRIWSRSILVVAGCAMAVAAILALRHAGVEWGLWSGPSGCGISALSDDVVDDLLGQIDAIHPPSCGEASWHFVGLSFAGWNAVISTTIALVAIRSLTRTTTTSLGSPPRR